MSRTGLVKGLVFATLIFPMVGNALSSKGDASRSLNVVLIVADDLGWADTTLYGKTSLYETPNIERLAARGMRFSNAYACQLCSPTRASIITGQNSARHGMTQPTGAHEKVILQSEARTVARPEQKSCNVVSCTRISTDQPTLGTVLKRAGYATAHFGKWHIGREPHSPLEFGYDVDIPHWHGPGPKAGYLAPWGYDNPDFEEGEPGEHIEDRMAQEAVKWLKNRDRTKPFYMNYWQFSVHAPFGAKPELIEKYRKKIKRGEPQQSPTYAAMVESLDDAVGTLLDALEDEGIADETIIVFYSDNGGNIHSGLEETDAAGEKYITAITSNYPLRGGKGNVREGGIRVPALMCWPGVTKAGAVSETRIQCTDLYPTLLSMLNVERPKGPPIDGIDLTSVLRGKEMDRGPIFTYAPYYANSPEWVPPSMVVHDGDWKLIRVFHHGENGAHQYHLYNLRDDIGEANDLAATHPEKVQAMDQLIENYIADANVIVPLPNPKFDPAQFDPAQIGVQKGGLKMPSGTKSKVEPKKKGMAKPTPTAPPKDFQGWMVRNGTATLKDSAIQIQRSGGAPFLAKSKIKVPGPAILRFRIRAEEKGNGAIQWREEGEESFPKDRKLPFVVSRGDWQELDVAISAQGSMIQLRVYPPGPSAEFDWIEIAPANGDAPQRWNF